MSARFEIVTGEGRTFGPFTLREMQEFVASIPNWICWHARTVAGAVTIG